VAHRVVAADCTTTYAAANRSEQRLV